MNKSLLFFLGIGNYIFSGFVFLMIWKWHIVTTFTVQKLNLIEAMGILLILVYTKYIGKLPKTEDEKIEILSISIAINIMGLVLGYVLYLLK